MSGAAYLEESFADLAFRLRDEIMQIEKMLNTHRIRITVWGLMQSVRLLNIVKVKHTVQSAIKNIRLKNYSVGVTMPNQFIG